MEDFNLFFWIHWGGMLLAMVVVWKVVKGFFPQKHRWWGRIVVPLAVMAAFVIPIAQEYYKQKKIADEYRARYQAAKAVFDEQCKQAGEKIYKTVDNVEGVMLLKVRPDWDAGKYNPMKDPMWPDAAASDFMGKGYIASFLPAAAKAYEGFGYDYVDVLQENGSIIRYSDGWKNNNHLLDEENNPAKPARYAITYENNVDSALRRHWVAGTSIRILDRQTDKLLAKKVIFAFEHGLGAEGTGRQPWLSEEVCPDAPRSKRHTVLFVNKVLIPKGENNDY